MICIYCHGHLAVSNSRSQRRRNQVWRRRKCSACGALFTSNEHLELERAWLVERKSGDRQPFCRDKLYLSIFDACRHRPAAIADASGLVDTVISGLQSACQDKIISSRQIAAITLKTLKRFDTAAAVQYHAFHK